MCERSYRERKRGEIKRRGRESGWEVGREARGRGREVRGGEEEGGVVGSEGK